MASSGGETGPASSLYWDWSPVGAYILDITLKLKRTHLQICVTSTVIGHSQERKQRNRHNHRMLSATPRKFGL